MFYCHRRPRDRSRTFLNVRSNPGQCTARVQAIRFGLHRNNKWVTGAHEEHRWNGLANQSKRATTRQHASMARHQNLTGLLGIWSKVPYHNTRLYSFATTQQSMRGSMVHLAIATPTYVVTAAVWQAIPHGPWNNEIGLVKHASPVTPSQENRMVPLCDRKASLSFVLRH